jgi:hypothetical protein
MERESSSQNREHFKVNLKMGRHMEMVVTMIEL